MNYITLTDQNHLLSSLYNIVNVPQVVWIDEMGKIVRSVEAGGSLDILREFDPQARAFSQRLWLERHALRQDTLKPLKAGE